MTIEELIKNVNDTIWGDSLYEALKRNSRMINVPCKVIETKLLGNRDKNEEK